MKRDGVSIIVPAYNEAGNISNAVKSAMSAVSSVLPRYEILIIDDASRDATGKIGRMLTKQHRNVRYVRRSTNGGLGQAFLTGVRSVTMPYVTWFPGDNDTSGQSLMDLVNARGRADLIMTYTVNPQMRPWIRRLISRGFTEFVNILLGFHIHYYNGCFVTKTELVHGLHIKSTGHGIFAELNAKLLTQGTSYKEIPFYHIGRKTGKTTAFRLQNILSTLQTIWILLWDVRLKKASL